MSRLRDLFSFKKPEPPSYGISKETYLTVMAAKAQLPKLNQVLAPKAKGDVIEGFVAPLAAGAPKSAISQPFKRGQYVVASPSKRTVLNVLVLPNDEAGFDVEAFLGTPLAMALDPAIRDRIRATWTVFQIRFEAHEPEVLPSMQFFHAVASRLGELTDGVIADPLAEAYRLPGWTSGEVAADSISTKAISEKEGLRLRTVGLRKFAMPEIELAGVPDTSLATASATLVGAVKSVLQNGPLEPGEQIRSPFATWVVEIGTEGLRLTPDRGTTAEALSRA